MKIRKTDIQRTPGLPSTREPRPGRCATGAVVIALGIFGSAQLNGQPPKSLPAVGEELPKVNPDGWTSSAVCGQCHQAIHAVWRHSLHSNAWSNGVFQAAYHRAIDNYGATKSRVCLKCHTPTVRESQDYDASESITGEGVTCDFCHSVRAVDLSATADPISIVVGKTKFGPLRHAQSPAHEIVDSQLHTRSEFCGACHEYKNPNGVTVLGTYSEWKTSSHAKRGKQCQDCHMPLVPGRVVALNVKRDTPTHINLHDISGSHDIERVRDAIKLEIEGYGWISDSVSVYIKVSNEGSGHCFPTGLPMHRAVLEVTIRDSSRQVDQRSIPFELVLLDDKGRPIEHEHEVFVQAARVRSDTRLKPGETRTIDVAFRDISASRLAVKASLYYEYTTEALVEDEKGDRIEPVEMKFLVASRENTMRPLGR